VGGGLHPPALMGDRMRKTITYELTYFKKGEELKKQIPIRFISNGVYEDYIKIAQKVNEVMILAERRGKLIKDLAWASTDRKKSLSERRAEIAEIKHELKQIDEDIRAIDGDSYLRDRFKLIKTILEDNGVTDKELFDYKFWDKHTEASEAWGFLAAVVMKDRDTGKKKAV
jgi:seryl-tRNA synthetase